MDWLRGLVWTVVLAAAAAAQTPSVVREQLEKTLQLFDQALATKDAKTIGERLAERVTVTFGDDVGEMDRARAAAGMAEKEWRIARIVAVDPGPPATAQLVIRQLGDAGMMTGPAEELGLRTVWEKRPPGRWLLVSLAVTEPPQAAAVRRTLDLNGNGKPDATVESAAGRPVRVLYDPDENGRPNHEARLVGEQWEFDDGHDKLIDAVGRVGPDGLPVDWRRCAPRPSGAGSDGPPAKAAKVTVEAPPGALPAGVKIAVRAAARPLELSYAPLDFRWLSSTVELSPEGLRPSQPVTIRLEAKVATAAGQLLCAVLESDGVQEVLPAWIEQGKLTCRVPHFSRLRFGQRLVQSAGELVTQLKELGLRHSDPPGSEPKYLPSALEVGAVMILADLHREALNAVGALAAGQQKPAEDALQRFRSLAAEFDDPQRQGRSIYWPIAKLWQARLTEAILVLGIREEQPTLTDSILRGLYLLLDASQGPDLSGPQLHRKRLKRTVELYRAVLRDPRSDPVRNAPEPFYYPYNMSQYFATLDELGLRGDHDSDWHVCPVPINIRAEVENALNDLLPSGVAVYESLARNGWLEHLPVNALVRGTGQPHLSLAHVDAAKLPLPKVVGEGLAAIRQEHFAAPWKPIDQLRFDELKVEHLDEESRSEGRRRLLQLANLPAFQAQPIIIAPDYVKLTPAGRLWFRARTGQVAQALELPLQMWDWAEGASGGGLSDFAGVLCSIAFYCAGKFYGDDPPETFVVQNDAWSAYEHVTVSPHGAVIKAFQHSYNALVGGLPKQELIRGPKWYELPIGRSYLGDAPSPLMLRLVAIGVDPAEDELRFPRLKTVIQDYLYAPGKSDRGDRPRLSDTVDGSDLKWDINQQPWVPVDVVADAGSAAGGQTTMSGRQRVMINEIVPAGLYLDLNPGQQMAENDLVGATVTIVNPRRPGNRLVFRLRRGTGAAGAPTPSNRTELERSGWPLHPGGKLPAVPVHRLIADDHGRPTYSKLYELTLDLVDAAGKPVRTVHGRAVFHHQGRLGPGVKAVEDGWLAPATYGEAEPKGLVITLAGGLPMVESGRLVVDLEHHTAEASYNFFYRGDMQLDLLTGGTKPKPADQVTDHQRHQGALRGKVEPLSPKIRYQETSDGQTTVYDLFAKVVLDGTEVTTTGAKVGPERKAHLEVLIARDFAQFIHRNNTTAIRLESTCAVERRY